MLENTLSHENSRLRIYVDMKRNKGVYFKTNLF